MYLPIEHSVRWSPWRGFGLAALMAASLELLSSCTAVALPPPPTLPVSAWGGNYLFKVSGSEPQAAPAASVPVTIAVVNPLYKEEESALATPSYGKVGRGFSGSLGSDLEKILIAKGITTTGPFASLDDMTYSDKKSAALTLAPRVFIAADLKYESLQPYEGPGNATPPVRRGMFGGVVASPGSGYTQRRFTLSVTGWISFVMQEPLSGEKMWIKKLDLDAVQMAGTEVRDPNGELKYDGKADAMASALKELYPIIIAQFGRYLDPEEMQNLKAKGEEIRKAKVY